ncbi:MAG: CHAT domain-containing protein, partial [Pirellulales bacterium]|nr:CHAT domain-containing protein [Pirellulales bacterium]
ESMGEYAKAEPLFRQALEIFKKVLCEAHPAYADGLNNLAALYYSMGEYAKAEPLLRQALEIRKKVLGEAHPDYAQNLNNLAALYESMGEYAKAEPLFRQALEIFKKVLGEAHPAYAAGLNNLAALYYSMGEYAKAEPLLRQALEIRKKVLGEAHPHYADGLNNLAALYYSIGEYAKAEPLHRQALEVKSQILDRTLSWLPEAQAITLVRDQHACPEYVLAVSRKLQGDHNAEAFQAVWKTRAPVARMLMERRQLVADSPKAKELLTDLQSTQQQLAQLTLAAVQSKNSAARQTRLRELNDRKEELETQLAKVSETFRRARQLRVLAPEDLMRQLPESAAVLQFVAPCTLNQADEKPNKAKPDGNYDAFILRRAENPQGYSVAWVDLGAAKPIGEAIAAWRVEFEGQAAPKSSSSDPPEKVLRQKLWDPLEPHLAGCSTLYLLPDGDLNFIPWAALPGRKPDTCLLEDYTLATASHGRQLYAALTETKRLSERALLVGGVNYQESPAEKPTLIAAASPAEPILRSSPAMKQHIVWNALPGTAAETAAIEKLRETAPGPVVLQGLDADKQTLRQQMPQCGYIHLATHGFFADEQFRSAAQHDTAGEGLFSSPGGSMPARRGSVTARNPLILSGVVLAGANLPPKTDSLGLPSGDDGIMTAEEIVALNLRGTRLVVLSACDTGLGRVSGGEGVMGLVRAFQLAGARNVVASLWKVDDQATAALMQLFYYKLWKENKRPIDALREAQLAIYRHPEQIPQLATARGPDFAKTKKLADGGKPTPAARTAPLRQWAAFIISGPGN